MTHAGEGPQTPARPPAPAPVEQPQVTCDLKKNGYNWPQLIAGALAGVSILGAAVSSWNSGRSSQSADSASQAKFLTIEQAQKAKDRLDKFETEQESHVKEMKAMDARIEANLHRIQTLDAHATLLEKRLNSVEKKLESDTEHVGKSRSQ